MPRTGRIVLTGYPHHVVQRGHDRKAVFAQEADCSRYLVDLKELKEMYEVRIFAYCLMTNHVHLLLQPERPPVGLGLLMKARAARTTRYRNRLERRSGTLWESRYKSSVVHSDEYLLSCCRYIELNPVRARMVVDPADYPWSSYGERMGHATQPIGLDQDPAYDGLAQTEDIKRERYRQFMLQGVPAQEMKLIRDAVQRGQLTGNSQFQEQVAQIIGRRVESRGRGRPTRKKLVEK